MKDPRQPDLQLPTVCVNGETMIDARDLVELRYLDRCKDCGQIFTTTVRVRHDDTCYLNRPAEKPEGMSWWRRLLRALTV